MLLNCRSATNDLEATEVGGRFQGRTMEALLAAISAHSRDQDWAAYLRIRYGSADAR